MKKNIRVLSIIVIALVLLSIFAYQAGWFGKSSEAEISLQPANNAPKNAPPQPVKVYIVKEEVLEDKITAVGSVASNEEVALACETSGKITKIFFEEGSNVTKGQLLLTLNDAELQAQLKRGIIQKEFLEKRKARNEKLRERDGISEEEFELLNAELNRQIAENEAIKSRIEQTKLVAPFSGRIGLRYVSEGSYINPNTKVADLIDISTVKLNFAVPEKYMGIVKKGTKVKFTVAGIEKKEYEGTVYAIEPKIDASTRTIQVRAISNNRDSEIYPGAFANISIVLNKIEKAHLIPTAALIPEMNQMKVFVVRGGKAESVNVITGTRTENKIQILDGLSLGDTVITSGILQVRAGSNVKVAMVE